MTCIGLLFLRWFHRCLILVGIFFTVSGSNTLLAESESDEPTPATPIESSGVGESVLVPSSPVPEVEAAVEDSSTTVKEAEEKEAGEQPVAVGDGTQSDSEPKPANKSTDESTASQSAPTSSTVEETVDSKAAVEVRALTFKGIEAGSSTQDDVVQSWGEPSATEPDGDTTVLLYDIKPFHSVAVSVENGTVTTILIELVRAAICDNLEKKLKLDAIHPVKVFDQTGKILGVAYPERGVLLGAQTGEMPLKVDHILLEPISADSFILRAKTDRGREYQRDLTDVNYAIQLAPEDAEAHWLKAKVLLEIGQPSQALESADVTLELEPDVAEYRLTRAAILRRLGRHQEATQQTEFVLADAGILPEAKAQALCQLGDLTASGTSPDHQKSIQLHMEAIRVATPLAVDRRDVVRRLAKKILIDAHLGVALDIAEGNWRRKHEVVPKWIDRAALLADDMTNNEQEHLSLHFMVSCRTLAVLAAIQSDVRPTKTAERVVELARALNEESSDELFKRQLAWELGAAYVDALRIVHYQGQSDQAMKYGTDAVKILEEVSKSREATSSQLFLLAELYFLQGSVYAIFEKDHDVAVEWYDKSTKLLTAPLPKFSAKRSAQIGDWLVSMGVSYWRSDDKETALEMTEKGSQMIEEAVQGGDLNNELLAIPYGNLANMYHQLGNQTAATQYMELAAKFRSPEEQTTRK